MGGLIGTARFNVSGLTPYYAGGIVATTYGIKVETESIYRPLTCTISTYEDATNPFILAHINMNAGSAARCFGLSGTVKIKYSKSSKSIYIYNTKGDYMVIQRLANSVGSELKKYSTITSEPTEPDLVEVPITTL